MPMMKLGVVFLFAFFMIVCMYLLTSNLKGNSSKVSLFPVEIHATIYGHSPNFCALKKGR